MILTDDEFGAVLRNISIQLARLLWTSFYCNM